MENKRQTGGSSLDHIFGPKDSSSPSSSSSSSSVFGSIFSPPSTGLARDAGYMGNQAGNTKYGNPDNSTQGNKASNSGKDSTSLYQDETVEPCYLSSSIYYGGQENYSPRTRNSESHVLKKDDKNDDQNGNNSNSASRGNWWQGSLYY